MNSALAEQKELFERAFIVIADPDKKFFIDFRLLLFLMSRVTRHKRETNHRQIALSICGLAAFSLQ
ncbi:MAG: hypothetical protein RR244_07635 [Oscillospiraceae bacterium]